MTATLPEPVSGTTLPPPWSLGTGSCGYREDVSIRCGHCGDSHETIDDVRACAEQNPYYPEPAAAKYRDPAAAGPMHCGQAMVRIVYGYPTRGTQEAAARGEIRLGGCVIDRFSPDWKCPVCGHASFDRASQDTGGLAHVNMSGEINWDRVPDPPWWTKVRMRLQYWITGDV